MRRGGEIGRFARGLVVLRLGGDVAGLLHDLTQVLRLAITEPFKPAEASPALREMVQRIILGPVLATPLALTLFQVTREASMRIAARDGGRLTTEMVLARNLLRDAIQVGDRKGAKWGLILTVLLGALFTTIQVYEYAHINHEQLFYNEAAAKELTVI